MKSIRMKLITAFSVVIVLMLMMIFVSFQANEQVKRQYDHILYENVLAVDYLDDMLITQANIVGNLRAYLLYADDTFLERIDELSTHLAHQSNSFLQTVHDEEMIDDAKTMIQLGKEYGDITPSLITVAGQLEAMDEEWAAASQAAAEVNSRFIAFGDELKQQFAQSTENELALLETTMQRSTITTIVIASIAIVGGLVILVMLSRSIRIPLEQATKALAEMADGNLAIEPIHVKTKDETERVAQSLNKMLTTWQHVIRKVNDTSAELAAQSEELSASAEESLASSEMVASTAEESMTISERQANYVEQSTHSLHEVGLGIDQITVSNEEMLHSADEMGRYVLDGKRGMDEVALQMRDIHNTIEQSTTIMERMARKSSEIQEASSLIAGISEQTNLLALNAAIEAARAGEHGSGFAVVAEEVRNLAEESTRSAAKIDEMIIEVRDAAELAVTSIMNGQQKVTEGLERTTTSLETFNDIERSVADVHDKIETVSAAVEQIQAMTNEVLTSTSTLQSLAQQSTEGAQQASAATEEQLAAMEQISASSEQLSQVADDLRREIAQFRIS